ncbi:lytic transglycosylase domain-containing protein [Thiocapsa roseopersicina]|uniref:Transglycosylase SLT domain-containing protein n=2 Tax=Thiocapsa TaxID=1056 RepID=A0A1H2YBB2_THIRO|nr:lytic transglycosylase domain-containing protein [Thiocapsa roseopersicina]SDX02522.1 Transglycosylase SLT domain-containing protein [Thiocapsa roseopersicina]
MIKCAWFAGVLCGVLATTVPVHAAPETIDGAPVGPPDSHGQASLPSVWAEPAGAQGIEPNLLYAAALSASGRIANGRIANGQAAPWPWTLVVDGRRVHYATREDAQRALDDASSDAATDLAVGLLAVPVRHLWFGGTPAELLDPARNLARGAALIAVGLRAYPSNPARGIGQYRAASDTAAETLGARILALAAALSEPGSGFAASPVEAPEQSSERPAVPSPASSGATAQDGPRIRTVVARHQNHCIAPDKQPVAALVEAAARRHGVDPAFALAIARRESAFRQTAVSPKGATGVMQLMPATAARYGANPRDLEQNIDAGVRYLRDLAGMFDGDPALVAAGYNAGEGAVIKHGYRIPPYRETRTYVPRVLESRSEYLQCRQP